MDVARDYNAWGSCGVDCALSSHPLCAQSNLYIYIYIHVHEHPVLAPGTDNYGTDSVSIQMTMCSINAL